MSTHPSVAVVIRCRNEAEHVGRLLRGIREQTVQPDEIVAVDSGSTDATVEILERHGVRILRIDHESFSFGRSLNIGVAETRSDIVVVASAHVYPLYATWLERLIAPFEQPDVACSYGRQVGAATSKYSERRIFATWYPTRSAERQLDPFCNNANAAVRREVWRDLPYDESLTGLEDLDWAKRAMARGHAVAYQADAPVVHVHDETVGQIANRYRREAIAHKIIYGDQRMHLPRAAWLALTNLASDYGHAVRDRELGRQIVEIPAFRIAQFWGTYRGFAQQGPVSRSLRERFFYPSTRKPVETAQSPDELAEPIDYDSPEEKRARSH